MSSPFGLFGRPFPVVGFRTRDRGRFGDVLIWSLAGLAFLSAWCGAAGRAEALSYPPRLNCMISGTGATGTDEVVLRGVGFGAHRRIVITVKGHRVTETVADAAGSFQASAFRQADPLTGATVIAADGQCSAATALPAHLTGAGQPSPSRPPAPSGSATRPEPVPPQLPGRPVAAAIPTIGLTGLRPQLFLGLVGAILLAGTSLIVITGRLGHR